MNIEFKSDFFDKLKKINKHSFLRRMTDEAGVIAVNFSKDRFIYKNWIDKSVKKWESRQRPDRGSLLVRTGRLKRSVRKIMTGDYYIMVGTDVPYAKLHNEGGTINETVKVKGFQRKLKIRARSIDRRTGWVRKLKKVIGTQLVNVKAHLRKMNLTMPKRQFIGDSSLLARRIEKYMINQIDKEIR